MTKVKKIRPFSNGLEFYVWQSQNCDKCAKQWREDMDDSDICEIDDALTLACVGNGLMHADLWERAGGGKSRCTEFVKAETPPVANGYDGIEVNRPAEYIEIDGKKRLVF